MSDLAGKGGNRPFITRMLDALMPSLVTAAIVGFGTFKLMEYRIDQVERAVAVTQRDIAALQVQIPVLQSQSTQYVQRLDESLKALADLNNKMDARITFIERYLLDKGIKK